MGSRYINDNIDSPYDTSPAAISELCDQIEETRKCLDTQRSKIKAKMGDVKKNAGKYDPEYVSARMKALEHEEGLVDASEQLIAVAATGGLDGRKAPSSIATTRDTCKS